MKSLTGRLLIASALLLPAFLGATGYFLDIAFQRSLQAGLAERLQTQIYLLLGAAEMEGETLVMPQELSEPLFTQVNSGLYAVILDAADREVWRSSSGMLLPDALALETRISPGSGQTAFVETKIETDNGKLPAFLFAHNTLWESDAGQEHRFRFHLLQDQTAFRAALRTYRNQLWRWLGALSVILLVIQLAILRWGLMPLRQLAANLKRMQEGETQTLSGEYPREVQEVTDNLNRVLEREHHQRERYRNSLGDLAHSLKTPLAALRGALDKLPNKGEGSDIKPLIDDQVSRMNQIVSHQLQRAIVRNAEIKHQLTDVTAVCRRLHNALDKVYHDKQIRFHADISSPCHFRGDERDLMEVLGNLLENAFKYCDQQVQVSANVDNRELQIRIGDDGPGVPTALQQEILQRGARADTAQPGQGIGLAMAVEIISGYDGSLSVGDSPLGGAEFRLNFPA